MYTRLMRCHRSEVGPGATWTAGRSPHPATLPLTPLCSRDMTAHRPVGGPSGLGDPLTLTGVVQTIISNHGYLSSSFFEH